MTTTKNTTTWYPLLPEDECFAKTHSFKETTYPTYLESYRSHVDLCQAYSQAVAAKFCLGSPEYLGQMVELHDIGKRAEPFQALLKAGKRQRIRHETMTFLKWLEGAEEMKALDERRALAILAHHVTLLDREQAATIERHLISHPSFRDILAKWNKLRGTPWGDRMNTLLLETLPLVDYLRTVDVLASYTSEVIFQKNMGIEPQESIFAPTKWILARELSCFNLRADEIGFETSLKTENELCFKVLEPVKSVIHGFRRGS